MTLLGAGLRRYASPAAGAVVILGVWWLLAVTALSGGTILATPPAVVHELVAHWSFYTPQLRATGWEALRGYLYGNLLAIGLAVAFFGVPFMEKVLLQLGVASYCLPIIAIGPILATVFHGDAPQVALAGISCFLTTLVNTLLGLRAAEPASLDLIRAYGGGAVKQVRYVRLRASLPSLFTGLQIAAPAAVLGAIVGEWLGADSGIGVAMVNSEQALNVNRTYALAVCAAGLAGVWYGLAVLVGRLATPWAPHAAGSRA